MAGGNAYYGQNVDQEIGKTWQAYHEALKRKDAEAASDLLVSGAEILPEFKKYRDKLPSLAEDVAKLNSCKIYDDRYAICIAMRMETVKGQKMNIGYSVSFWKGNGAWKLERP